MTHRPSVEDAKLSPVDLARLSACVTGLLGSPPAKGSKEGLLEEVTFSLGRRDLHQSLAMWKPMGRAVHTPAALKASSRPSKLPDPPPARQDCGLGSCLTRVYF